MTQAAEKSWPADQVERRSVAELVPYARNARTHSPAQVAEIAGSIREWGWTIPVLVDETGGIIAGHGRVLAALQLGLPTIPVMVATGWSEAQKRAYVIADNQLAQNAGWDEGLLRIELGDLDAEGFSLDLLGFSQDRLDELLSDATAPDDFASFDEGIETEHECPKCHFRWSGSSKPVGGDA